MTEVKKIVGSCAVSALLFVSAAAHARPPAELADLEGARASSGESQMNSRGYKNTGGKTQGGQKWTYWYNKHAANPCVGIVTSDGRYETIQGFDKKECGHGGDGGAVAGVAIAALLGAALLSHGDKHHKDGNHYSDNNREANYERGYNDGVHDGHFVNYDHNQDYSDGFAAGQREREHRLSASRYAYSSHTNNDGTGLARQNCAIEAARYWGMPVGTVHSLNAVSTGHHMYDVTVAAGYRTGVCTVNHNGDVKYVQDR